MKVKALVLIVAMSMAAQARPSFSGGTHGGHTQNGAGRVYNGSITGSHGGTVQGTGGHVVVPGSGAARAGTYNGTGANGGTFQSQGANVVTKQGGFHQNSGSWNGQNSSGSYNSSGSWKAGQGGQSSTSAEATSKKTGQTYSVESNTQYDPNSGGSTTVTTGNGTTKTVTYPAQTTP
ncbi:hypothetical protein JST97_03880 [bacterium]|nr:hypothetical protein [bacterium]